MAGRHEKPGEKPEQPACGHCGSTETTGHCFNARCTWVKCGSCYRLTDVRHLMGSGGA